MCYFCAVKIHEKYIKRCIELAKNGLSAAMPNPSAGAVITYNNKIIGEGYTSPYGGSHAEVNAINAVTSEKLLKKATIYVSLEPCSHYGKTPPCSDLIIRKGIKNVVIGCIDPFSKVAGRGVQKLKDAGCRVTLNVLKEECEMVNKRFFTYHTKKRPYIILKWAQSLDGYIGKNKNANTKEAAPIWITNSYSRQLVHKWRAEEQGILVGTTTVINDNPKLNTRDWHGKNPTRIILDAKNRIPKEYAIYKDGHPTLFIIDNNCVDTRIIAENSFIEKIDFSKKIAPQLTRILYEYEIQSVIIEGGTQTLESFINESLWDEARVFTGNINLIEGVKAPQIEGVLKNEQYILNDHLKILMNI